ncbi:hypothetical protein NEAUS07_0784 [Nematocida ausubeli]|nr:hypothetical protein NEAUS07_0784 [Nematocida ausubeli]
MRIYIMLKIIIIANVLQMRAVLYNEENEDLQAEKAVFGWRRFVPRIVRGAFSFLKRPVGNSEGGSVEALGMRQDISTACEKPSAEESKSIGLEYMKEFIVKHNRGGNLQEEGLLLQCDPLINKDMEENIYESSSSELEQVDKLCERKNKQFWYTFNGVTVFNKPYIYDICVDGTACEILNNKDHEKPRSTMPHRNIFTETKHLFSLWRPEMTNIFYCGVVLVSIFSTYYLDKLDVSASSKELIRKTLSSIIQSFRAYLGNGTCKLVLNNEEISKYIEITRKEILSGKNFIFPSLIDVNQLIEKEKLVFETVFSLGIRGSELPKYVYDLANICIGQAGLPNDPKYDALNRLIKMHMYIYSYEGMVSLLCRPNIKDIAAEHLEEVFKLYGGEILHIILAVRQYFSEAALLCAHA